MTSQQLDEKAIFNVARKIETPDARVEYLRQACGADESLFARMQTLLTAYEEQESFLELSPVNGASQIVDRPLTEQPGDTIGPYKLLQQIGEGGMGVVYMAEQSEPMERQVALKIIKQGMDTRKVIARFEAERQALAMMDHPNIAKVLDAGKTDTGRPYFVMELVKGVPITDHCDEHRLGPRQRLELFVSVCQAVQHAHQKGIIHRDIKPSNVLVAQYDAKPVPKIIDFGVAKAVQQRLTDKTVFTEFGQVVGTIEYMSPEQAQLNQLDIDTRTDVYSLGVLLYELLTGDTPFDKERLRSAAFDEMLRIIREEEPPRLSLRLSTSESLPSVAANRHVEPKQLSALVHGELDWIAMKALEKDRARRYETASKFAEDVQHYLDDEAVEACPPSRGYKLRKFARRNKTVIATTAAVAVALVAGIVGTTWQAIQATHERDRAIVAEGKIETEAAIAKAVNDFLQQDLLGMAGAASQAEAQISPDPSIKLRTLLDRAAEKIEQRFSDQPLVEAAIRETIGKTYNAIGDYSAAEKHLERAVELRTEIKGASAFGTLWAINDLAGVYWRQARFEEAGNLFRQTIEARRLSLGKADVATLASINSLALVRRQQGLYQEAEALHRQVLETQRDTLGTEHPHTLASMTNLALVVWEQGRYREAEELYLQALELFRSTQGDEHPHTLETMCGLAMVYRDLGELDKAEQLLRKTLEVARRIHGDEHPATLETINSLGLVCRAQGSYEESIAMHRETLEVQRRVLGEEHLQTLRSMGNLAIAYDAEGRFEEAEQLLQQTLDIQRRVLGEQHPDTLIYMRTLANCYRKHHHYEQAETFYHEALEGQRATLGAAHPETLATMINLATNHFQQEHFREAEMLYRDALDLATREHGTDNSLTLVCMERLKISYLKEAWKVATSSSVEPQTKTDALRAALAATELVPEEPIPWVCLGIAYYRNGRWQEAVDVLEKVHEMTGSKDSCYQFFLAMSYWKVGREKRALTAYMQAVKVQEAGNRERLEPFRQEAESLIGTERIKDYHPTDVEEASSE